MPSWTAIWEKIPPVGHTLIHVAVGAALAYGAAVVAGIASGDSFDTNAFIMGLLTAIFTAVAKGLNPADPSFGVGATTGDPNTTVG